MGDSYITSANELNFYKLKVYGITITVQRQTQERSISMVSSLEIWSQVGSLTMSMLLSCRERVAGKQHEIVFEDMFM